MREALMWLWSSLWRPGFVLFGDEDVAGAPLCAVVSGEEDEDIRLLFNRIDIVARIGPLFGLLLGWFWAAAACCGCQAGKLLSLSIFYFWFLFLFYFS
jgi:hypothetical protein